MDWQPIETAPKDGEPIQIFVPHGFIGSLWDQRILQATWYSNHQKWVALGQDTKLEHKPTHWMPLPEPPQDK